jgi:hypothetical protein
VGGGGSEYSPATGVLDTSFDGDGIVVHNNAAEVIKMMEVIQSM